MKKLLLMALLLVPTFSLSGCGKKRQDEAFLQENLEISVEPLSLTENLSKIVEKAQTSQDKLAAALSNTNYFLITIKNKSDEYYFNGLEVYIAEEGTKEDDENIDKVAYEFKLFAQPNEEVQIPIGFQNSKLSEKKADIKFDLHVDYNSSPNKVTVEEEITKEQMEKAFNKVSKEKRKDIIYPNEVEFKDEGNEEMPEELAATFQDIIVLRKITIVNNSELKVNLSDKTPIEVFGYNNSGEVDGASIIVPQTLLTDYLGKVYVASVSPGESKTFILPITCGSSPETVTSYFTGLKA